MILLRYLLLLVLGVSLVMAQTTTPIDCGGKDFFCISAREFVQCSESGPGVFHTTLASPQQCPERSVCDNSANFECSGSVGSILEPQVLPAPIDPSVVDPAPVNPSPVDPSVVDPAPVNPSPVDPSVVDPAPVNPSPVDPSVVDPAPVNPSPVDPSVVDPAPVNPSPVDPSVVDPAPVNPSPVDPSVVDPAPVNPSPIDPSVVDPAPVNPSPVDPAPKPFICERAGRFPHESDKTKYYICIPSKSHFVQRLGKCSTGEEFDLKERDCEDIEDNHSENSTEEEDEDQEFRCVKAGKFPMKNNQRKYYECKWKRNQLKLEEKECKRGEKFDADEQECD